MIKDNTSVTDKLSMQLNKGHLEIIYLNVNLCVQLFDEYGVLKDERILHNTVTTAGKQGVAAQILAAPDLVSMGWMAIGTGSPTATLLGAEVARVAFDSKTRSGAIITVVGTFGAGVGTSTVTEAGTFAVVTANTAPMWMSASFGAIVKAAADSIVATWTLTVS